MVNFVPPALSSYSPVKKRTSGPQVNNATSLISTIPGVGVRGIRGAVSQQPQVSRQVTEQQTPLQRYQQSLQNRISQGQRHTEDIQGRIKTRTAFNQKYNAKNYTGTQQGQAFKQPGASVYRGRGRGAGGWGGFSNGNIPVSALIQVSPGHYMEKNAGRAFSAMNAAYRQAFGRDMSITDSYRPLGVQQRLQRTKPGLAAPAGTSNHGWGKALDLGGGINKWGTQQNNWMHQNAARFGFAPLGGRKGQIEPWHWEYRG